MVSLILASLTFLPAWYGIVAAFRTATLQSKAIRSRPASGMGRTDLLKRNMGY